MKRISCEFYFDFLIKWINCGLMLYSLIKWISSGYILSSLKYNIVQMKYAHDLTVLYFVVVISPAIHFTNVD